MASVSVTVIGLGNMGFALAKGLLEKKHNVTVWNRTASKAEPLAAAGAKVAASVPEAIRASDVIMVCVLNYKTSDEHLQSEEAAKELKGKTLIQVTTGTPNEARAGAAWATSQGITYLDGAIMGEPSEVGNETFTHLYAGSKAAFDTYKPMLLALGSNAMYMGENPAHASAFDCSILSFFFSCALGFVHGASLADAEGLDLDTYQETAAGMMSTTFIPMMKQFAKNIKERKYPGDTAKLSAYVSATNHIVEASSDAGVDKELPATIASGVKTATSAGHGEEDFSAIFEVFRKKDSK